LLPRAQTGKQLARMTLKVSFLSLRLSIRFENSRTIRLMKSGDQNRSNPPAKRAAGDSLPVAVYLWCLPSSMFNQTVLDHFRNPRNVGDLDSAAAVVQVTNPVCGDVLRLSVGMENGRISSTRFKVQGCVAAIASGSALTEILAGKSPAEASLITAQIISDTIGGLPQATFHAAELCADAVAALLAKLSSR
jgi:nitrogen fixation NifU-like protein